MDAQGGRANVKTFVAHAVGNHYSGVKADLSAANLTPHVATEVGDQLPHRGR